MIEKLNEKLEKSTCYVGRSGFKDTRITYLYNDGKQEHRISVIFHYNKNYSDRASISYFRRDLIRYGYNIKNIVDVVLMAVNEIKKYFNVKIRYILPIDMMTSGTIQNEEKLLNYREV